MIYEVTPGVFIDGTVIDASDFLTEYENISQSIQDTNAAVVQGDAKVTTELKAYVDNRFATVEIDGGTF